MKKRWNKFKRKVTNKLLWWLWVIIMRWVGVIKGSGEHEAWARICRIEWKDGTPIRCYRCGSYEMETQNVILNDLQPLEYDCVCGKCKTINKHWCYGTWGW